MQIWSDRMQATWLARWRAGGAVPCSCADPVAERAQALAAEVGGEALASNAEVAERAELVVLCHKPAQLRRRRAAKWRRTRKAVASILAATPLADLRDAYPDRPVYRFIPSLPVEVRQGAVVQAAGPAASDEAALDARRSRELFAELGTLVVLADALVDVAMGLMSCAPAYVALVAEAQIDAGVRRGIPAAQGAELVVQTLAGTAELLRRRGYDTLAVRREVTSPGGLTARGLDALERGGAARGVQRRARRGRSARRDRAGRTMILASARTEIADYLSTLIYVYTLLIFLYIVVQLLFSRRPAPAVLAHDRRVLGFLRDVCEPFLRIFRRLLPSLRRASTSARCSRSSPWRSSTASSSRASSTAERSDAGARA